MAKKIDITGLNIPSIIAIILDGNGRWAKKRFLPRKRRTCSRCKDCGEDYLKMPTIWDLNILQCMLFQLRIGSDG